MILSHCVKVYVPSTSAVSESNLSLQETMTEQVLGRLADLFGGATLLPAQGAWRCASGKLVREAVNIVYSFCQSLGERERQSVLSLAYFLCQEMAQEAVAVEFDGVLHLISLPVEKQKAA